LDRRDIAFVTECFYGVIRWRLYLDKIINERAKKGVPRDPELANILRLGVFQLTRLDRVPARAAIHSMVGISKRLRGEKISRFVNGLLRNIDREPVNWADPNDHFGHPQWLIERWARELGTQEALLARLKANMMPAATTVRLHPDASPPEDAVVSPFHNRVFHVSGDLVWAGIKEKRWLPQDPASAAIVEHLDVEKGHHVLELCAGRGVKTTQIAEAVGPEGLVVSVDLSCGRLSEARRLVDRWCPGVSVHMLAADASAPLPIDPNMRFDRILVDAPCTGLGVIRRRPEILWRRTESDISTMASLQKDVLAQAVLWGKQGARCVYAVCTTTPEETSRITANYDVIDSFHTSPEIDGCDGFYSASLAL